MALSADAFSWRFRLLILIAWNLPPVVGLGFLLYIRMFTPGQMIGILTTPVEPVFIVAWILISLWYFSRFERPVVAYLRQDEPDDQSKALYRRRLRQFPLHFWALFLIYILMAPSSVILSGEWFTDFTATPLDWFRIHLVALIVSIIVGLPIFFLALDLFGLTLKVMRPARPLVSIRLKVLLLGALMPLLVDTMIVQYYWTRTGYFSFETFVVWLVLELLAIGGSLLFVRSLGQSLWPLQHVIRSALPLSKLPLAGLDPRSTDELGVIAGHYQSLLKRVRGHNRILRIGARLIGVDGKTDLAHILTSLVDVCQEVVGGDKVFLILHDEASNQLVGIAQTGEGYNEQGFYRLSLDETSTAVWIFNHGSMVAIDDTAHDPRVSPEMRRRFNVRSTLGAPLVVSGHTIGVVMTIEAKQARQYSKEDMAGLAEIASEAALAINTHRLMIERERAQAAIAKSEEQTRLLLDSTVEAIYGVDIQGNCIFVNRACLDMLGYVHEDELLGKSIHELIHHSYPDGSPYPKQDCGVRHATLSGEISHCAEEVHWRKDGTSLPVEYWSRPIYKADELVGGVVTFIDITERRAAEQALTQLHQRNELLLQSTSDGIIGVDEHLCCTFANQSAATLLGYSQVELIGQDIHQLIHNQDEEAHPLSREQLPLYKAVAEAASQHTDNAVLMRKNGEAIPVQYSANPIHEDGRVTGAVMVFRNIAEARAIARKMDYLASHDALTGLLNRREFELQLEHVLDRAREEESEHVLCYLDLDQFKVVNDTCGHEAGDELLRQLANLLHGEIRHSDVIARLGGDEFGLLLDSCPLPEAIRIADQLRAAIEDYRFAWEDKTFAVGVSIGVVAISAEIESISSALSSADAACYVAKDSGRNRIHVYELHDDEMNRRRSEMHWVSRLNQALDEDRFLLRFQPIVSLAAPERQVEAMEILLAMRGEDGAEIPPGAFIPAAERYNLMVAIDRWVVGRVFRWLREHKHRLGQLKHCFINLSGQSVGQEKFLEFIVAQLEAGNIPADKLCFEVTETAAVANMSRAIHFIKALKVYGCRFALDDFGSGMSSFSYLKTMPLDYLKIDGNFVRDMVSDPIDHAMVQSIHQVGHVMQIGTIAEFVESEEVLRALQVIGVDYAQGYGIARPMSLDGYFC